MQLFQNTASIIYQMTLVFQVICELSNVKKMLQLLPASPNLHVWVLFMYVLSFIYHSISDVGWGRGGGAVCDDKDDDEDEAQGDERSRLSR